jgi:hypothetical protein
MKEPTIDRQRTVVAHGQAPVVPQPRKSALNDPAPFVSPQASAVLRGRLAPTFPMRNDQLEATPSELLAQRIAVVTAVGDHPVAAFVAAGRDDAVASPGPTRASSPRV